MTDDTTDEPTADDADERTNADGGRDDVPATATHEYVWRCSGCKAQYDERPEQCERCGATDFQNYREL